MKEGRITSIEIAGKAIPQDYAGHWDNITESTIKARGDQAVFQTTERPSAEDTAPLSPTLIKFFDILKPVGASAALTVTLAACSNVGGPAAITASPTFPDGQPTSNPSFDIKPGNTPTPTPDGSTGVIPTPTPEATPTPTPTKSPEKPPVTPDINKVKVTGGKIEMKPIGDKPYYYLDIEGATIVAVNKPDKNGNVLIGLTTQGSTISKQNCGPNNINGIVTITFCEYKGATTWINVGKKTAILDSWQTRMGTGADTLEPYLKVGKKLPDILIGLDKKDSLATATVAQIDTNVASFNRLKGRVGEQFPRSNKGVIFYAGAIITPQK